MLGVAAYHVIRVIRVILRIEFVGPEIEDGGRRDTARQSQRCAEYYRVASTTASLGGHIVLSRMENGDLFSLLTTLLRSVHY